MAQIQLVVSVCITLSVLLPGQAHNCFSKEHGCDEDEIKHTVDRQLGLTPTPTPTPSPSSEDCQAWSEGSDSKRSVSPWRYLEDFNATRYPQTLWHASCSCTNCISLKNFTNNGHKRIYTNTERNGNSVAVTHSVLVFYRKPCETNSTRFYLVPKYHPVKVACICVAAKRY